MATCTVCSNPIIRGLYCKPCRVIKNRERAKAKRHKDDYGYKYYRKKKAEERAKLKMHLRPCQDAVDELNKEFPWLAQVDDPRVWKGEIPAQMAA